MKKVIIGSVTLFTLLHLLVSMSCTNPTNSDNQSKNSYLVHLVGRVLTKDGNPVPYAITHLSKFNVFDTTDSKGTYEITIASEQAALNLAKNTADTTDSLYVLKDGQIITHIEILNYIDTLPDILIVQRDITGKIDSKLSTFSRVEAIIWNHADAIQKSAELFYSKPTYSYSGFIYFVYTGTNQNYSVYVNAYSSDSLFIGRSDTISFSSIAGNIVLPLLDPTNAIPLVHATTENSTGINDTFELSGTATDKFGGTIIEWEWDVGNTGNFVKSTPDSNIKAIAPSKANSNYQSILRVMDNDSNIAYDTVTIVVETRSPIASLKATPRTPGLNDTVVFSDSSLDTTGVIVSRMLKFGNSEWITWSGADTSVNAPGIAGAWVCSLKVIDDDGEIDYDVMTIMATSGPPIASLKATTPTPGLNDTVVFSDSSLDTTGVIVSRMLKFGNSEWITWSGADTSVNAPGTAGAWVCSLRVVDDDGEEDTASVACWVGAVTDGDNNTYTVVKIGNQLWTVENLRTTKYNDGTDIPHVTGTSEWSNLSTPGYCFYNNSTDAGANEKWGALYNWYAVNTGKLAPEGWRVPTDVDWTLLENYLIANGYNYDGSTSGDKTGKSLAAKTDWASSSTPGNIGNDLSSNNITGFSALPGGCRSSNGFSRQSDLGYWWSATETSAASAYSRYLYYYDEALGSASTNKEYGFSVRLVRDFD